MSLTAAQLATIDETARLNPSTQWVGLRRPVIDSDTESDGDSDPVSDDSDYDAATNSDCDDSTSSSDSSSDDDTTSGTTSVTTSVTTSDDTSDTSDYIGYYLLILTTGYCTLLIALFITNNENIIYSPPAIIFIIMFGSMLIKLAYALWSARKTNASTYN